MVTNSSITRFGVSIPSDLIQSFDSYIRKRRYKSRSEAIRDLIRERLVAQEWEEEQADIPVIGVITYVYEHHRRELAGSILDIQHAFLNAVVVTQHVHLDHHNCLEIAIVRGRPQDLRDLSDRLKALKGVKHCTLTMTTTGALLS